MKAVVFLGPTMPVAEAREILDAVYLPPAGQADLLTAAVQMQPDVIGLIDGVFLQSLSVWHKEILYAVHRGIRVYGSSSMGALRAAETAAFGMIGVGEIYRQYASGALLDDDEVAVAHGPAEEGWAPLSLPMVNVRATLAAAERAGVVTEAEHAQIVAAAKDLYFPHRTLRAICAASARAGVSRAHVDAFAEFMSTRYVDRKKEDAVELLTAIAKLPADAPRPAPFDFARNSSFITLYDRDRRVRRNGKELPLDAVANYVSLHEPDFEDLNFHALNRAVVLEFAYLLGVQVSDEEIEAERVRFLERRKLTTPLLRDAWLRDNDLDEGELRDIVKQLALCRRVHRWYVIATWVNRTTSLVLDELRLTGRYPELADRAAAQEQLMKTLVARRSLAAAETMPLADLVADHREWADWEPSADPVIWAEEAGYHTKANLKMELARARAARHAMMALLVQSSGEDGEEAAGGAPEAAT